MRPTRSDTLKASMSAAVYAAVGLVFYGEYPLVGAMFATLSIFRIFLYFRLRQRLSQLPDRTRSAKGLDTQEGPD